MSDRPYYASVFLIGLLGFSALIVIQDLSRPLPGQHFGYTLSLWLSVAAMPHLALAAMLSTNNPDASGILRFVIGAYGLIAGLASIAGFAALLWAMSETAVIVFLASFGVAVLMLVILLGLGFVRSLSEWISDNWPV